MKSSVLIDVYGPTHLSTFFDLYLQISLLKDWKALENPSIMKSMKNRNNPDKEPGNLLDYADENIEAEQGNVVNLAVYRIKKSLKKQGFDLVSDDSGKLTLVLRLPK